MEELCLIINRWVLESREFDRTYKLELEKKWEEQVYGIRREEVISD